MEINNKKYSIKFICNWIFYYIIIILVSFARFLEAQKYINKKQDYKLGIEFSRENKLNSNEILIKKSSLIPLNDSLMYFKNEIIKL